MRQLFSVGLNIAVSAKQPIAAGIFAADVFSKIGSETRGGRLANICSQNGHRVGKRSQ